MFACPAADTVDHGLVGRGHFDKWCGRVRELPEFAGELPVATLADEILTPGDRQIHAFVSIARNPVSSTPEGKRLSDTLSFVDFMVSVNFCVNETARRADVILAINGPESAFRRRRRCPAQASPTSPTRNRWIRSRETPRSTEYR